MRELLLLSSPFLFPAGQIRAGGAVMSLEEKTLSGRMSLGVLRLDCPSGHLQERMLTSLSLSVTGDLTMRFSVEPLE